MAIRFATPAKTYRLPMIHVTIFLARMTLELSGAPLRRVRWSAGLGNAYFATVARIAQARAVNEIDPFAITGIRSRRRSRRRALAASSSDMAYAGAGPWPPRKGCQ